MNSKLLDVLRAWSALLAQRGLPVPPEADLEHVAASGRVWPSEVLDPITQAWQPTIQYLEKQVRFGVTDPLPHMSSEQWALPPALSPSGSVPPPSPPRPADAADDQQWLENRMNRLRAWDASKGKVGAGPLSGLSDVRLRKIAQSTPKNRRTMLTGFQLGDWAGEINALLDNPSADESAIPRTESAGPAPARPPAAARTYPPVRSAASAPEASAHVDGQPASHLVGTAAPSDIDPHGFAEYDYSGPDFEREAIRVSVTAGKSLALFWNSPDDDAEVRIYRVVAGDDDPPWSPESGRVVAVTTETDVEDSEPFAGAVRHLQVWYNRGRTVREAKATQPVCIAEKMVVSPVLNFTLREEAGTVTGEWEVFDRIERVQIYRVPVEKARQGSQSPLYRIQADDNNLGGFKDDGAERGRRYIYQVVAETTVDEVALTSAPVSREQQISVVLERVNDLEVRLVEDDDDYFDVVWTAPPTGRVAVYRSQKRPAAGIEDEELPVDALAGANLSDDNRLSPVRKNIQPNRDGMLRVPWPPNWPRAYFTPVTVLDNRAVVGRTVARTRVVPVRDAELIERVNEQMLTFSWPPGAAAVWVYQSRRHTDASLINPEARPNHEISAEAWRNQGGYHFVPPLPRDGCAVHLCAVAFQQGETFRSAPVTVDYPGLRIVRYATRIKRNRISLAMMTETPLSMPTVHYALIANRERFPLDIRDGIPIKLSRDDIDGATPEPTITPQWVGVERAQGEWTGELNLPAGRYYLRLFADLSAELLLRLALLDPPMSQLVVELR